MANVKRSKNAPNAFSKRNIGLTAPKTKSKPVEKTVDQPVEQEEIKEVLKEELPIEPKTVSKDVVKEDENSKKEDVTIPLTATDTNNSDSIVKRTRKKKKSSVPLEQLFSKKPEKTKITIYLDNDNALFIENLHKESGKSINSIINVIIDNFREQNS